MHPLSGTPDKSVAPTSTWPLVSRLKLHDARTSGFRPGTDLPPLATTIHRPRIDRDRAGPDLDDRPPLLFSMSPNRATASGKSNFSGLSPVGAPGRVAGGHFRRAQPSRFAPGCAPTGEHLRGYFLVERNSFRFSRLLADLHHLTTAKIWVSGGGAGGDVPDALTWIPTEEERPNENASALPENPGIFALSSPWLLCSSKSYRGVSHEVSRVIIYSVFVDQLSFHPGKSGIRRS